MELVLQEGGEQLRTKFAGKLVRHESLHVLSGNQYYVKPSDCGGNLYCFQHMPLNVQDKTFSVPKILAANVTKKCKNV